MRDTDLAARVNALADEWERKADDSERTARARQGLNDENDYALHCFVMRKRVSELRAILTGESA